MEIRDPIYSAGPPGVDTVQIVDIDPTNRAATLVADLTEARSLPAESFDCAIVTHTLQFLRDVEAALLNLRQSLRADGTLILTVPTIIKIDHEAPAGDYWRWTPEGLHVLLERHFPGDDVQVEGHGNVLAAIAFLMGLARQELTEEELAADDPNFPIVACGRVDLRP